LSEYSAVGRTDSAAFLLWFLNSVYRMDEVDAADAVCDRQQDEGIDAIAIDELEEEVVLFQAKRKQSLPGTLGDTELKKFIGTLEHFASKQLVDKLSLETKNTELKRLLTELDIAERIGRGYSVRQIFIANIALDGNGVRYVSACEVAGRNLDVWDLVRISPVLDQLNKEWFVSEPYRLRVPKDKVFKVGAGTAGSDPSLVFAAVPASDLLQMPGISDFRIFAQNVRLGLGQTRVNKDIKASVMNKKEHRDFLAFHNGLTIVAKDLTVRNGYLKMNHYSVCNGCQSLLTFSRNSKLVSRDLEVLVRFVRVGDDRQLADAIAYRTNNQNPITLKDLSSNDPTQVQIKSEFDAEYSRESTYGIKKGSREVTNELPNELAGQLLLSLYNGQPWSAH